MNAATLTVDLAGLAAILWIAWYFWLYRKQGTAATAVNGAQEIAITVKGGYDPDTIVVKKGLPVRLHFTRREGALCSETVLFDTLQRAAKLPEGQTVTVDFTPDQAGEIPFQCQMGMLHGKLIVTD